MEFTIHQVFPAGLDRLWAAFGQPGYPRAKYLALGATAVRIHRFDADAETIEVDLERTVPVDAARLPAWVRRWLGSALTLRQRSTWRRAGATRVTAELEIAPVGLPVRAHGTGTMVESVSGTTDMTLNWRVDSPLPMLRGRVEQLFAEQVRDALESDHRFTVPYLDSIVAGRRPLGARQTGRPAR